MNKQIGAMLTLGGIGFVAGLGAVAGARTQDKTPLLEHTFDVSEQGWTALGAGGKVSVDTGEGQAKEGKGALRFDYSLKKGEIDLLLLPTPEGTLEKMKSLRFWVKSDRDTPLAVVLQEMGGGRYLASFTIPRGKWQKVELAASDFVLSRGADDPKDSNNKLDLALVEAVGITDMMALLVQTDDVNMRRLLGVEEGSRTLRLDSFVVSEESLPDTLKKADDGVVLDTFARPQLGWTVFGKSQVKPATGIPLGSAGIQADYTQTPSNIMGLSRGVPLGTLTGAKRLAFRAAASKSVKLLVQVEEAGGGKYNTLVEVPEGSKSAEYTTDFADFKPADDSKDSNGKLDLDQVYQVILIDLSGPINMVDRDTTFWVGGVKATK